MSILTSLTGDEKIVRKFRISTTPIMSIDGINYIVPTIQDFYSLGIKDLLVCDCNKSRLYINNDIKDVILGYSSAHIHWFNTIWKPDYLGLSIDQIAETTTFLNLLIDRGLILRPVEPTDRIKVNIPIHGKYSEYSLTVNEYIYGVNLRTYIKGLIPFKPV